MSEIILLLVSVICFDVADTWLSMPVIFFKAQQPVGTQGLPIIEASQSHSDTPHSVGLLWTRDQPDTETTHYTQYRQISTLPAKLEPAIPASERPKTHALGHAVIGI